MEQYDRSLLRLLDAALNRATEGIRVLEDCARMLLNHEQITRTAKNIRHDLSHIIQNNPSLDQALPLSRNTSTDVLKTGATVSETTRADIVSLVRANASRAEEAVRALEEYSKLILPQSSVSFKDIRFRIYDIEQQLVGVITRREQFSLHNIYLGMNINLDTLSLPVTSIARIINDSPCNLLVINNSAKTDDFFIEAVQTIRRAVNTECITFVKKRIDIAIACGVEGVLLSNSTVSPAACREIAGYGFIIGYEHSGDYSQIPENIDVIFQNENRSINLQYNITDIPVITQFDEIITEPIPDNVCECNGVVLPFPDNGDSNIRNTLLSYQKHMIHFQASLETVQNNALR